MDIFLFLCGLIAFVYFLMTWVLPKILSWIFAIKYEIKVTIGFIKIPYLTLKDINISRNGISVHIDEIRVTSSLFNSEVSKLFAFIARDVRLNKVILVTDKYKRKRQYTESLNISDIKLPTSFITFAQFTYIQLTNISAIWAGNTGWSIHTTATELKLEGNSSSKSHGLAVAIEMSQAKTRIQRRTESNHLNFAEICFAINANLVLFKLIPDKINIAIRHPSCIVNEDLFKYIEWSHEEEKEQTTHMQFLKLIPKNFMLEVDDTEISSTLGEGKDLNAKFQACRVNIRCNTDLEYSDRLFYLAFQMDGISVDSCTQKVFLMNTVSLDAKLQNKVANVYILLNTVTVILNPELWPCIELAKSESPKRRHEKNIFDDWSIQSCAEVWTASGTLSNKSFLLCGHMKLIMEYVTLQWRAELLLESLGWTLAGLNTIDRRSHTIGTPLFLAVALLKFSYTKRHATIDAMFDAIRMEWNSEVSDMLSARIKDKTDGDSVFKRIIPDTWALKLTLSNINLFFVLDNIANISLRFDSLAVEGSQKKISIRTTGLKILELDIDTKTYICVRSKDIMKSVGAVKSACFDISRINQNTFEWTLMTSECFEFFWTYILHMKIISILRSFPKQKSPVQLQRKTVINWTFCFNRLNFNALLLNHELLFDGIQMYIKGPVVEIRADSLNLFVDKEHVIISDKLSLSQSDSNIELLRERDEAEGLESKHNNAWIFSLSMLEARFPYKHNFADAIQNELVSTIKWLKKVHNKKKVPFTLDSPLPRDLLIKIDECLFEMSDDPFEVKLRDNYELLEDEYKESLKRQQMLDAKIAELCKTHLLLPSGKVDELYASLSKKNAEIYVQRSKQISSSGPQRTRLLEWRLTELSIAALADLSVHGTERALNFLRSVDPVSPFPIEGLTCSTLWVRTIAVTMKHSTVSLRDFPQPFLEYKGFHMWGRLAGAEPVPPPRSIRVVEIDLSPLWDNDIIERGMTQLKFYYDINLEMEYYSYAFGPCWEPVIAQCNLSMENIFSPSRDPSPPLPFWDKMRLLLHGRLTMVVKHMTVLLHASLDPYNTTEEMELAWSDMALDWTNAKIVVKGDLDIYVRTASKYDDCRLLHLPNLKLTIKLNWVCLADPNDHHVVIPCAPDKLPEYSSNQEHDSYRAFRSQNIDTSISLETKGRAGDSPALLLYGSTLRWFESLQLILSGVTRPTRRGLVFGPLRARKKTLSRHYRKVRMLLSLQQFQNSYWMSCAMQRGFELLGSRVVCSSEHCLTLIPINDGLIRRPKAVWSIAYMNCELANAEVWLKSSLQVEQDDEMLPPIEKFYCLSVEKVSYGRETPLVDSRDTPTHKLVVYDLKGAWTKSNRDVAFALFDAYVKTQQLRRNLSAEALRTENIQCEVEQARPDVESKSPPEDIGQRPSPASMLQKLIAEAEHKAVVFSDDQSPAGIRTQLQGLQACQLEDVLHKNWLIALVNSQVVLRGCETKGYVILSAAKAEILQRLHGPTPKTTWVGSLECLQYYATVGTADEDIMWLPVELIQERCGAGAGPAAVVGSGRAAGGVVSQVVGAAGRQLQRIVSRCRCEFFYVSFDSTDPSGPIFDAFTLMHHDLDVCTNSVQYAMLLDIVNSLLLYVEPTRKEAAARLARLRFQLQLRSDRSVRVPVQKLQTQVRVLLGTLRRLERDAHLAGATPAARRIHKQLSELKSELSSRTEELDMLLAIHRGSAPQTTVRSHEIYFKHAQWRLTDADGQLGIADLVLSNFLYTKNSKSDGSVEHLLELGYIHMTNLLPNQIYTEVLSPTEIQRDMPVDHKHVLRVFCRERPPVGGISVKEHFEINVLPITIGLTKKFYNTMLKFCFPERDDPDAMQSKVSKDTSFYVRIDQKDDVEKMKERAEKNKLFIYIKIPEVPVRVSYKGNKEKNIEDVRDFSLVIPTLEYHNVTWTWLDLLLAMKSDTRRVILSQAIKQKLQIHRGRGSAADQNTPQEADKARMLFGKLHPPK